MKDTVFVVNPAAGSGRTSDIWRQLLAQTPELGEAALICADQREVAARQLSALPMDSIRRVVVLGGDGTVHWVANVLLDRGQGRSVELGLVPAGTGSDLARSLGLSRRPETALRHALASRASDLDVLHLTTRDGRHRWVINIASVGVSGLVDQEVNALPRRSPTAYLSATLRALGRYRPVPCRVRVDGELWYQGKVFLLAVANGRSFGKGMKIAPRAEVRDGLADIVLVEDVPRWQLPLRLPQLYLGRHLSAAPVRCRRGQKVEIEPLGELPPFDVDGEEMASAAAAVELVPRGLRFVA